MERFAKKLNNEILKGLPGTEVQWQMASSDRKLKNFPRTPSKDTIEAAILILLYRVNGSLCTVLMQRHDYKGVHGGQISFPGGKKEFSDENLLRTAIREATEETGIDPEKIKIINTLTPLYIPVSKTIVTPVLAWTNEKPVFVHKADEVVFLFDVEIKKLMEPGTVKIKPFKIRGEKIEIKYYDYEAKVIWGATAMILHELLTIIQKAGITYN